MLYLLPFLSYKGVKIGHAQIFETFLFVIRFWWFFFHLIPCEKCRKKYSKHFFVSFTFFFKKGSGVWENFHIFSHFSNFGKISCRNLHKLYKMRNKKDSSTFCIFRIFDTGSYFFSAYLKIWKILSFYIITILLIGFVNFVKWKIF